MWLPFSSMNENSSCESNFFFFYHSAILPPAQVTQLKQLGSSGSLTSRPAAAWSAGLSAAKSRPAELAGTHSAEPAPQRRRPAPSAGAAGNGSSRLRVDLEAP